MSKTITIYTINIITTPSESFYSTILRVRVYECVFTFGYISNTR